MGAFKNLEIEAQEKPVNVVFTGPAYDAKGNPILREDLVKLAACFGHKVQKSVQATTELVVASRTDTVKAKAAAAKGLKVLTYPEFIHRLGGFVPVTGATADPMVDPVELTKDTPATAKGPRVESETLKLLAKMSEPNNQMELKLS